MSRPPVGFTPPLPSWKLGGGYGHSLRSWGLWYGYGHAPDLASLFGSSRPGFAHFAGFRHLRIPVEGPGIPELAPRPCGAAILRSLLPAWPSPGPGSPSGPLADVSGPALRAVIKSMRKATGEPRVDNLAAVLLCAHCFLYHRGRRQDQDHLCHALGSRRFRLAGMPRVSAGILSSTSPGAPGAHLLRASGPCDRLIVRILFTGVRTRQRPAL